MLRYYADLYLTSFRFTLKSWLEYRADFGISLAGGILAEGATLVFLSVVFSKIQQLEGWSFPEMVLIWGLATSGRSFANTFLDIPQKIGWYVQFGRLDLLLVRPAGLLFQIMCTDGITLSAFGRAVVGIAAIAMVLPELHLPWWSAIYLPLAFANGVVIFAFSQLLIACLSFWVINARSAMAILAWMNQFGSYPITIFSLPLRFLFTWLLPYAMMGFYPAAFLLRGGEYQLYGLLAPLVGAAFLGLSLLAWRFGLRHYQSTGS
jgi:ABC-2 type transport system permease protein